MQQTNPSTYTDVEQADFDRFKTAAKARGMNISGNKDDVEFDRIPLHVEYTPEQKVLVFTVHEPHWLAPGVTLGALHQLMAAAMNVVEVPKSQENPVITHDHTVHKTPVQHHDAHQKPHAHAAK